METQKTQQYYESRIDCIIGLYREGDFESLTFGKEKIEKLVKEYKEFPQHDPILTSTVEDLILDYINMILREVGIQT